MSEMQAKVERRRNIAVGATALFGLVGIALLFTVFGYTPPFIRGGYEVTLYLENAAGLHENSRVTLSGLDIGTVERVELNEAADRAAKAKATLLIREGIAIPETVVVRIETPLFGGGPTVALVEPSNKPRGQPLAVDGSAVLGSATIIDPLEQLEVVSRDIGELKETWVALGDNINVLLSTDESQNASLPRVLSQMEQRLAQLEEVLDGVDQLVNNPQLREDITESAANIRALTEQLDQTVANLEDRYAKLAQAAEKTLSSADDLTQSGSAAVATIERRFIALADDASKTMDLMDSLLEQANSDEGSLGLLLNDPQLYHNMNDSAERLRLMIDESRLLIEKWKAEGVPLRVFQ